MAGSTEPRKREAILRIKAEVDMDTGEALVSVDGMPENGGALPADSASMLGIMVIEAAMVARMDKALYEVLTSDAGMSHDGAVGIIVAVRQKVND